jgi:hypothetical protein
VCLDNLLKILLFFSVVLPVKWKSKASIQDSDDFRLSLLISGFL